MNPNEATTQAESERVCAGGSDGSPSCGHDAYWFENGFCHAIGKGVGGVYCGHRCVFPDSERHVEHCNDIVYGCSANYPNPKRQWCTCKCKSCVSVRECSDTERVERHAAGKPYHKFNRGRGATLCTVCSIVITEGLTSDLYCTEHVPAEPPRCYWCRHPHHPSGVCPVPFYVPQSGEHPCGCVRSMVIEASATETAALPAPQMDSQPPQDVPPPKRKSLKSAQGELDKVGVERFTAELRQHPIPRPPERIYIDASDDVTVRLFSHKTEGDTEYALPRTGAALNEAISSLKSAGCLATCNVCKGRGDRHVDSATYIGQSTCPDCGGTGLHNIPILRSLLSSLVTAAPAPLTVEHDLAEFFKLLQRQPDGRWCFLSLSRDQSRFDEIVERLWQQVRQWAKEKQK